VRTCYCRDQFLPESWDDVWYECRESCLLHISGSLCAILLVLFGPLLVRRPRKIALLVGSLLPAISFVILSMSGAGWVVISASILGEIDLVGGFAGVLTGAAY
jgi:hypothetical protein